MRLMVYSHDAFGLGNIRRMLAICKYLLDAIPNLSILLVSGSPMLHSFRLPERLDYIKLPCLNRGESGQLAAKYLSTSVDETLQLRAGLILTAALNFKPDLVLVDKKPYGLRGELTDTIQYLKMYLPKTRLVLLLRDILDSPDTTTHEWRQHGYYEAVESFYDQVLVVGMPEVFDLCREYRFSTRLTEKVQFCGYIHKEPGLKRRYILRQELGLQPDEQLVLVTPGGGEDGYRLVDTYLSGLQLPNLPSQTATIRSLIVCGSEMPSEQRQQCHQLAASNPAVQILDFTDDLMSYIDAADLVVCMSGYNTISEVLSMGKRAIAVPRIKPGKEQLIRAERMAELGLLQMIHPNKLNPALLIQTVCSELSHKHSLPAVSRLDLQALPRIAKQISDLLFNPVSSEPQLLANRFQSVAGLALSSSIPK